MKQVSLETVTQGYVHVTFSNGPRNLLDADTITELSETAAAVFRADAGLAAGRGVHRGAGR